MELPDVAGAAGGRATEFEGRRGRGLDQITGLREPKPQTAKTTAVFPRKHGGAAPPPNHFTICTYNIYGSLPFVSLSNIHV